MFRAIAKKYWETIRYHQWQLFFAGCILMLCFTLSSAVLPTKRIPVHLRFISLVLGFTLVSYAVSLGCYFFDSWRKQREVVHPTVYRVWLGFETLVGLPFAAVCLLTGIMSVLSVVCGTQTLFVVFLR